MNLKYDLILSGYTICNDSWFIPNESVIYNRIYYVYDGDCLCSYEGKVFSLKKNHLYFFPSMRKYSLINNSSNPLKVLWFHVDIKIDYLSKLYIFPVEDNDIFYHYIKLLEVFVQRKEYNKELLALFDTFLSVLSKEKNLTKSLINDMDEAVKFIEQNISNNISVEKLANHLSINRCVLSRKFKHIFGMNPRDYILSQKLNRGAKILLNGGSVYGASKSAGYEDEKAFSRAFKKYMEISPSEYRKKYEMN